MSVLLEAENIAHFYGSRLLFKNISCTINSSEIVLLAGANGAGKSTLLRILAELLIPAVGKVTSHVCAEETVYIGHATFLYAELSAVENLFFWAKMYGLCRKKKDIIAVLEQVNLANFAYEKAGSFSRGMAQRLNLARMFMLSPKLLFLDEPATGLDIVSTKLLHERMLILKENGCAIVWISHDILQDKNKAEKLLYLESGKLQQYDNVADFSLENILCAR